MAFPILPGEAVGAYLGTTAIVGLQMGIMALLFTIYNLITRKSFRVKKKDLIWILVSGIFGTTLFHGFTILGVNSIGATVSSLLYGFAAAFALIIEILLFHRKKTALGAASIVVSLIGVYILMDMNLQDLASTNFEGYILNLASIASWVIYTFLCDKVPTEYDKTIVLNYQAFVGVVTVLPFALLNPVSADALLKPESLGKPAAFGRI